LSHFTINWMNATQVQQF